MKLDDGPPTGVFDRAQCLGCPSRLAIHHPSRSCCLHADHAHMVGHDVVQLSGNADSLRKYRLAGVLFPFVLEFDGLIGQPALTIS